MNGIHRDGRNCDFEKTYPGCLGRMVGLFELNVGASANRLLNDKPHQNGSPLSRSISDESRMSPSFDPMEERAIVPEFKESMLDVKSNGTPMKMLIAQEMSKEVDSRQDPPNLVAKLMGLDAFPQQEPDLTMLQNQTRDHPQSHSYIPMHYCEQENGFFHYIDPNKYEDCGIWEQSQKSPHVARYEENTIAGKMALVRQKFIEAKRLSMNEELRQSEQFQDALEVLSSNRDLFLKCVGEPDSKFSENVYSRQSDPHPLGAKRITVLRPSKMAASNDFPGAGNKDGKPKKKGDFLQVSGLHKVHPGSSPPASLEYYENSTHPTRIVVLKPSSGKARDVKAIGSLYSGLPRMLHRGNYFGDVRYDQNQGSREAAKAITQKVRKSLERHCRDETLISSMLSNSYLGDESSFNKSEIECANDNLSDSEATSPVSRSSWDYVNRLSPYSSSSLTRASYFSESSVCREAKKRLSERWAMMISNGVCQEQRCFQRSSSTLGEMLALSETKTESSHADGSSSSQEPKDSDTLLVADRRREVNLDKSPRNLLRSKSLPVSTTESGGLLNVDITILDKSESLKEDTKARTAKSTFKGKVSSLFFSRNKKPGNDKSLVVDAKADYYLSGSLGDKGSTNGSPLFEPSSTTSSSNRDCKLGLISLETGLFVEKPIAFVNPGENQDHPSPVSVLDPPYEADEHIKKMFPHHLKLDQQGVESQLNCIGSHLIDKSPPIGSISRSLSWDGSCVKTGLSHPPKKSFTFQETEEQEWFYFVKALLSVQGEGQSDSYSGRWYSLESPLNPSLRDKYIDLKDKKTLHDTKQRLVFDCVNEVLVEIAGCESHFGQTAIPCIGANDFITKNTLSTTLLDEVWARMKVLFSDVSDDCVDNSSLVMERVVRKEVMGPGWSHQLSLELVNLGKAIERRLLEELVLEVVVEFTGTI